jgi:hypothetical protein
MVHFPGLARTRLWIQRAVREVHSRGFPHSDIPGSKPACGSPRLFAACHVLLRLLAPRHPPYALSSLTIKLAAHAALHHAPIFRPIAYPVAPGKFAIRTDSANKELVVGTHRHPCRRQRLPLPHSVVKEPGFRSRRNLRSSRTNSGRPDNKKPGVERRARPSMQDGPARCSTVFLSGIRNQPHLVELETGTAAHLQPSQVSRPFVSIAKSRLPSSPCNNRFDSPLVQIPRPVDFQQN